MNPAVTNTNNPALRETAPSSDTPVASTGRSFGRNVTSSRGNTILGQLKLFADECRLTHAFNHFKSVLDRKITLLKQVVPEYLEIAACNAMLKLHLYKDSSEASVIHKSAENAKKRMNKFYCEHNAKEAVRIREETQDNSNKMQFFLNSMSVLKAKASSKLADIIS
ncbi:MAG: hypothetical protein PUP46_01990 [Endozoicomonas sp. (ex Botrylloides leachii)]|nr:hypothetical protein [Endozoicomonas sp. (ex Botrylloides leachii)]